MNEREDRLLRAFGNISDTLVGRIIETDSDGVVKTETKKLVEITIPKAPEKKSRKPLIIAASAAAAAVAVTGAVLLFSRIGNKDLDTYNNRDEKITAQPDVTDPDRSDAVTVHTDTDPAGMLDDTMPENPFDLPAVGDYDGLEYYVESYVFRFDGLDSRITDLVGRDELTEWINEHEQQKLTDRSGAEPLTVLAFVEKFGITKEQLTEAAKLMRDDKYTEYAALTDEDIDIIYSGDKKKIVEYFCAEYAVLGTDRAYSPMWLYEHTAEAYKAAGIAPRDISKMLTAYDKIFRYNERNMTDEAWRAFRKKLVLYSHSDLLSDSENVRTYTFETDMSEPFGDRAFEILEEVFYGEWTLQNKLVMVDWIPAESIITYQKCPLIIEGHYGLGVYETDEIYVLSFAESGAGGCFVIEKNAPGVMYRTDVLASSVDVSVVSIGNDMPMIYTDRKAVRPELKTGPISFLGLRYLEYLYGKDFETFLEATMDRDGYDGIEGRGEYWLANVYNAGTPEWYLAEKSETSVTLGVPYVKDRIGTEQTPEYFELRFEKDADGEWSVEYSPSDTDHMNGITPIDEKLKELISQSQYACGLNVTVSNVTRGSLDLDYYCEGEISKYMVFTWGSRYEIQKFSDGEWVTYDPEGLKHWNDEQLWFDSSHSINEFPDHVTEHETIPFYGSSDYGNELPDGDYRIVKSIAVSNSKGNPIGELKAYAEFYIRDETPNIFGVTFDMKDVTRSDATLVIMQSGGGFGGYERTYGMNSRYYVEKLSSDGKWERIEGNSPIWDPEITILNKNGETERKYNFSSYVGNLADGKYRISVELLNYIPSSVENWESYSEVLYKSVYYAYFEITESTSGKWGISLKAEDITPEGMTLLITQSGDYTGNAPFYGSDYKVQKKIDDDYWTSVEYAHDDVAFNLDASDVQLGKTVKEKIEWSYVYGSLPDGEYRLMKEFLCKREDSEAGQLQREKFYVEFTINTDSADGTNEGNAFGVSIEAKNVTAAGMTLVTKQDGSELVSDVIYVPDRIIERMNESGEWESYSVMIVDAEDKKLKRGKAEEEHITLSFDDESLLSPGKYRLKRVFRSLDNEVVCYAYFDIK